MEWKTIDSAPRDERRLLLFWKKTGHVEDGKIDYEGDHFLFDGQSLNDPPTHWAEYAPPQAQEE